MPILDRRNNQLIEDKDTRVSVGLDLPVARVPNKDGYFATTKTTIESVKNNIRLLLQTQKGERVFQPNLGMNLKRLMFEQMTEETTIQIENNIVDVFQRWLPFVEVRDIAIINLNDLNQVTIDIKFNIQRAPNSTESVQVTFDGASDGSKTSNGAY